MSHGAEEECGVDIDWGWNQELIRFESNTSNTISLFFPFLHALKVGLIKTTCFASNAKHSISLTLSQVLHLFQIIIYSE